MHTQVLIDELKGLKDHSKLWGVDMGSNNSTLYRLDENNNLLYMYGGIETGFFGFKNLQFFETNGEGSLGNESELDLVSKFRLYRLIHKNIKHAKRIEVFYNPETGKPLIREFGATLMNTFNNPISGGDWKKSVTGYAAELMKHLQPKVETKVSKKGKKKKLKVGGLSIEMAKQYREQQVGEKEEDERRAVKTKKTIDDKLKQKLDELEKKTKALGDRIDGLGQCVSVDDWKAKVREILNNKDQ